MEKNEQPWKNGKGLSAIEKRQTVWRRTYILNENGLNEIQVNSFSIG